MKNLYFLTFLFGITLSITAFPAYAQAPNSTFTTPSGSVIEFGSDTTYSMENFTENPIFNIKPQADHTHAHLVIKKGKEETHYYAQLIKYYVQTEEFILTGDARIIQGEDRMYGPKQIHFNPKNNLLVLEGTTEKPANFLYETKEGTKFFSEGELFHFVFQMKDGSRYLDDVLPKKGHTYTLMFESLEQVPKEIIGKLSPPQEME